MVNLTENELIALKSITHSDFYENGRESCVWDFSVYECNPLRGKTKSGTFGSLGAKGLIEVTAKQKMYNIDACGVKTRNPHYFRGESNCGTICITEAGYAALDALNLIDTHGDFFNN